MFAHDNQFKYNKITLSLYFKIITPLTLEFVGMYLPDTDSLPSSHIVCNLKKLATLFAAYTQLQKQTPASQLSNYPA